MSKIVRIFSFGVLFLGLWESWYSLASPSTKETFQAYATSVKASLGYLEEGVAAIPLKD